MLHNPTAVAAANTEGPEQSHQEPAKEADNNTTTPPATSPSSYKRPRSDAASVTQGNAVKRRNSGDEATDALDILGDVGGEHVLGGGGVERNESNWQVERESFEQAQTDDALDMDDILPNPGGNQWLLDLDENGMLNDGTQYFQLQETGGSNVVHTDSMATAGLLQHDGAGHLDLNLEPSVASLAQQKIEADVEGGADTASTVDGNQDKVGGGANEKVEVPIVTPPKASPEISLQMPKVQWGQLQPSPSPDTLANVQAPDIETRIIALPPTESTPQSSAIRIAPRDQSKSAATSVVSRPGSARTRSDSRPKRTRYSSNQPSPNVPAVAPAPISLFPVGSPNMSQAPMSGNVPFPVIPHPMAAPLLFTQGFPPARNPTAQREQQHNNAQFMQQRTNSESSKLGTSMDAASSSGHLPMFSPPQPGMMPVDPSTLMHMAQQMWMAAMAASGNFPHAQSMPNMNQAPILGQPILNVPGAVPNVPPIQTGALSNKNRTAIPTPIPQQQQQQQQGGVRPIFITDDGKHVVVEQQAPAKLMRHPVLGRLQLQSKQQAAMEQANAQSGNSGESDGTGKAATESPPGSSKERRKRLVWTPELHERFVQAIRAVGLHQAVPKTLVQIMNVEGLTTEHVKSHLQKYRNSLKKTLGDEERDKSRLAEAGGVVIKINEKSGTVDKGTREVRVVPNRAPVPANLPTMAPPTTAVVPVPPDKAIVPQSAGSASKEATEQSGSPSDDVRLQLQERTMQLQYQLQVMVHRTVTLQKELQVSIEEQSDSAKRDNQPQMATSKPAVECKEKRESGYIEQMAELDRETKRVRHELGMIQERLNKREKDGKQMGKG